MAFIIIVAILLLGVNPALGVIAIAGLIVYFTKKSGDSDPTSAKQSAPAEPVQPTVSKPEGETGMFYRGTCTALTSPIYSYRDGYVFKGVNYGTDLLNFYEYTYSGGFVRDRANSVVGRYRDGYIWLGRGDAWITDAKACYARGYVHEGAYVPELYVGNAIGTYTGDDEGAAACAIAMLLNG